MRKEIRIGTRGSALALWQANWVKSELEKRYPGMTVTLTKIKTTGDKILDVPLAKVGGKGLFTKEIEEALLRKEVDIAVHSMKDVPTEFPAGLHLACITEREDVRDALISNGVSLKDLKEGALIGTSSLRRQAQLYHYRPDLKMEVLRGNVETRIRKQKEGQFDAVILAAAGVKRLGLADNVTEYIAEDISIPAIGQGALGIECAIDDKEINELISFFNHYETSVAVRAERALLKRLEGGCQVPIAGHATVKDGRVTLKGLVGSVDGKRIVKDAIEGDAKDYERLGTEMAERLLAKGAREILEEVYGRAF
jgi:hydroxymethylbilane synthase